MTSHSLEEFANRVVELMPAIMSGFFKQQTADFYKMKITLPQLVVLGVLDKHGETRMSDLAGLMNVTTAAITGIADRMVRDGYLVRASDPEDRRIVKVKLTAKGISIAQKADDHKKKMMMKMFGMISEGERKEYLKILEHIHDHITETSH